MIKAEKRWFFAPRDVMGVFSIWVFFFVVFFLSGNWISPNLRGIRETHEKTNANLREKVRQVQTFKQAEKGVSER